MKFFKAIVIPSLCMILISGSSAFADAGKTGLSFLSLGNGARATGMGEAQTALAEGVNAVYWNPAGLGLTTYPEITFTHGDLFEDAEHQYLALAVPLKKGTQGSLGFSATRFSITNIEGRDAQATLTNQDLEQEDLNLQISYGFRIGGFTPYESRHGLTIGAGIKRISEELAGVSAAAMAADVGAQYRPGPKAAAKVGHWIRRVSVGISGLNLGQGLEFDTEETPLPQTTRIGTAYTHFLWGDALNLALDYETAKNGENRILAGSEFWLKNMIALRIGYTQGQDIGDEIRMGAGFRFQTLQLDYALAKFGEALGSTHRFSLTLRFGEGATRETTGLKEDLVRYYLTQAQDHLSAGSFHEAIINANQVLEIEPKNAQAIQILFDAGEKMKAPTSLPRPLNQETPKSNEIEKPIDPIQETEELNTLPTTSEPEGEGEPAPAEDPVFETEKEDTETSIEERESQPAPETETGIEETQTNEQLEENPEALNQETPNE